MAFKKKNTVDGNLAARIQLEKVRREKARRRAQGLTSYHEWLQTVAEPNMNWDYPHMQYIADKLDAVARGEIKRLMLLVPYQHGKSSVVTNRWPAYLLERNPNCRIAIAAATADLSHTFSRNIRNLVYSRGVVGLDESRQAVDQWLTSEGGGLKAVGVGGQIIGFSVDVMIIDDPVKSYEEANSKTVREAIWNWYSVDVYSRQQKDTPIILIMCMTGDTPVRMANGRERPLRDIKAGDKIATYDNGKLSTALVLNQRSNGLDLCFRITTTSGKTVRANGRHPFLVEENGQLTWIKLKNLTTSHKIVTVKDSGGSGKESCVVSRDVKTLLVQEDIVPRIITRRTGLPDIDPLRLVQNLDVMHDLNIDTELPVLNITSCLQNKKVNVQFVDSLLQKQTHETVNCVLTITMQQDKLEDYYATPVIAQLVSQKQPQLLYQLPTISDFTTEQIISIEVDKIEEVFDIEIEGTENFIANGIVSHNTHWNEDDLAGRLIENDEEEEDPQYKWTVVKLPAMYEGNDPEDYPVKRKFVEFRGKVEGESLCEELHPLSQLVNFRRTMGSMFSAGYQQRPAPLEGKIWKKAWFCEEGNVDKPLKVVHKFPANVKITQMWDTALEKKERNDPSAMVEGCLYNGTIYVAAMVNEKLEFPELIKRMRSESDRYNSGNPGDGNRFEGVEICAEDKAAAKPARQQLRTLGIPLIEVPSGTLDKIVRAKSVTHYPESGMVVFVDLPGNCNDELLLQLLLFDNGKHDDLHDAFVHLLRRLVGHMQGWDAATLQKFIKSIVQGTSTT